MARKVLFTNEGFSGDHENLAPVSDENEVKALIALDIPFQRVECVDGTQLYFIFERKYIESVQQKIAMNQEFNVPWSGVMRGNRQWKTFLNMMRAHREQL